LNGVCFALNSPAQSCAGNSCQCQKYLFNGTCYDLQLSGCLKSADNLYCDLCNDTLVPVNGRCFIPVKNNDFFCNVLSLDRNFCTGCNFQYLLNQNNICVKDFGICSDPSTSCSSVCIPPFLVYYNGNCYIKDPNCIDFNQTINQCTQCYDGYSLNANTKIC
jgi:hypothetical protein